MRKRVVFGLLILSVIIVALFAVSVSAATNSTTEQQKVANAYSCLENKSKIGSTCSSFSTEEKIFALWADDLCQAQVTNASSNPSSTKQCWPNGGCNVKTTAQAVLALDNVGADTTNAQNWLTNQSKTPTDLTWYLEIEPQNATSCTVTYAGRPFNIDIGTDKKISGNPGGCLIISPNGYWLQIGPSCYNQDFQVSCTDNFITTLLYQQPSSSTIHVSDQANSAAAGGTTSEQVSSYCLANGNTCSYEGTLWGALALKATGKDISSYIPYLITLANDNQQYLPDAFLYYLTGDDTYQTSLLQDQQNSQYWSVSGDKLYDTALALYPFMSMDVTEKSNSKQWLLSTQSSNGCWNNNVRDTAFLLASIWPKTFTNSNPSGGPTFQDCQNSGYYCVTSGTCMSNAGTVYGEYSCPSSFQECCSISQQQQKCSDQGGVICSSGQFCKGANPVSAADTGGAETCCIGGTCTVSSSTNTNSGGLSDCEGNGGACRTGPCVSGEQATTTYSCTPSSETCCVASPGNTTSSGGSTLWIWILLILIVLVAIGIIFRGKLRMFWLKLKGGRRSGPSGGPRFGPGPSSPYNPIPQRPMERRILIPPPQPRPQPRPRPTGKSPAQKELDDVLKKLKDMGK